MNLSILLYRARSESTDTGFISSECQLSSNEVTVQSTSEYSTHDFDNEVMSQASLIETKTVKTVLSLRLCVIYDQ
jgi:hypothetical protein